MLRIALLCEENAFPLADQIVGCLVWLEDESELPRYGVTAGEGVEKASGNFVLPGRPLLHFRIVEALEPAGIIGNFDGVVLIGNRPPGWWGRRDFRERH